MNAPAATADLVGTAPLFAPTPAGRLFGTARHARLVTAAGTGFATVDGRALTRWRGDRLRDADGFFVYLRDVDSGRFWSAGYAPTRVEPDHYAVRWGTGCAEIAREDDGVATTTAITVAPATDGVAPADVWRVTVENRSDRPRHVELTSYCEPVLQARAADLAHPAFSKLFVQTERVDGRPVLLARRRPRGADETPFFAAHALVGGGDAEWETDRMRFIGRGWSVHAPAALATDAPLSGTTGDVLDPVLSLRRTIDLAPGERTCVTFVLTGAETREAALAAADHFDADGATDDAFRAAEAAARAERVSWTDDDHDADALVAGVLYGAPAVRAPGTVLRADRDGDTDDLDLPTADFHVVVRAATEDGLGAVRALARAVASWRDKGMSVALLALCDGDVSSAALLGAIRDAVGEAALDDGAVALRAFDAVPAHVLADAHLYADDALPATASPLPLPHAPPRPGPLASELPPSEELLLHDNGTGGFTADGTEYVVRVAPDGADGWTLPPLPWSNVVANEAAGFVVTERGAGSTWAGNSREHRLTPWSNDPVEDPHGEALYLRDAESGTLWSAHAGPCPARTPYTVRHGWGYTTTTHAVAGLRVEATEFVPREGAVRVSRLRVTNTGDAPRRIDAVRYAHLVLGSLTAGSDRHVATEWAGDVLLATNPAAGAFADRAAFVAAVGADVTGYTADRDAFIGRHRDASCPLALATDAPLDGRTGAGLDPCAALSVPLDVAPGATAEVSFLLGEADGREAALAAVAALRAEDAVGDALAEVRDFWREVVGAVRIETPEPALDVLVNGWLLYQDLSCRIWGRTAFWQSGGAFGFRDQLQDAAALVYARPDLTRDQILLHAGHQFVEGDVLHWWHPPAGQGIRTHFSDDLHWLAYVTAHYVHTTGDTGVLDAVAPFLTAPPLPADEDEAMVRPEDSGESGTVYEHAVRALDRGLAVGAHGLPLMGTGDWNDGMNRVGREGRGESVWMGFFLYGILGHWAAFAEQRGDADRATRYGAHRAHLGERLNAEGAGWDGAWFRRATYDDGTPLGTAQGDECQIDALVQAWSVLSGAATPAHAAQALDAMEARLVDEAGGLIRLLTPAFDQTPHDPGYIKGYLPGVRENGGQYTHAALWAVRALAEAGRCERAAPLLAMLSPVTQTDTPEGVARYQTEPYAVAADVYGVAPHIGRGGWTWYTGSAGWMYRVAVESILGFGVEDGAWLALAPCLPAAWPGATLRYRVPDSGGTVYTFTVTRAAAAAATLDGAPVARDGDRLRVPLLRDGREHVVHLTIR